MKVNYLPKNRQRTNHIKNIFFLVTVFVLGATIFSVFDEALLSVFYPLWKTESAVTRSFANVTSFFTSHQGLFRENTLLKEKIASLEMELRATVGVETRQALMELANRSGSDTVIAAVLTRPPQSPYDTIIVDAGSNEFVSLGSVVSLPEGAVLGVVSEVFSNRSRVALFSSANTETPAFLERGGVAVTLIGAGAGNFKIISPQDTLVEIGDRILSADISSKLLAVVASVTSEPTSSFKEVLAKSPLNIFNMRFVLILK